MNCCEDFVVENPKPVRAEVIQAILFRYVVPADKKHRFSSKTRALFAFFAHKTTLQA